MSLDGLRRLNAILGVIGAPLGPANDRGDITPLPLACPPYVLVRATYDEARSIVSRGGMSPKGDMGEMNRYHRKVSDQVTRIFAERGIYEEC